MINGINSIASFGPLPGRTGAQAPAMNFAARLAVVDNAQDQSAAAESPASAVPDKPTYDRIRTGLESWMTEREAAGASSDFISTVKDAKTDYLAVVARAEESGGFDDPLQFVRGLDQQELAALQHTHGLAAPINPDTLTEEGAYNLLVPANQSRDMDRNGLTTVGTAQSIVFPPHDAPQEFKDAWDSTVADLDPGMRMTMELRMWQVARGGSVLHPETRTDPADYYRDGFDYGAMVGTMIESTEYGLRYQETDEQQAYAQKMLEAFRQLRDALSAA